MSKSVKSAFYLVVVHHADLSMKSATFMWSRVFPGACTLLQESQAYELTLAFDDDYLLLHRSSRLGVIEAFHIFYDSRSSELSYGDENKMHRYSSMGTGLSRIYYTFDGKMFALSIKN
jgi:hypothetical protein